VLLREYYAVKALPNPAIPHHAEPGLRLRLQLGGRAAARRARPAGGARTSCSPPTTPRRPEFDAALGDGGCILNLDDISLVDKVPRMPELVCSPTPARRAPGNVIIGKPEEAKYGVAHEQLVAAFGKAQQRRAALRPAHHAGLGSSATPTTWCRRCRCCWS
jgi:diaminopimelate decarboxylase